MRRNIFPAFAGDGEGCTRLFEVHVAGADSKENAKILSKSVVTSSLTKAAIYGKDANWGRILCALGYAGVDFDPVKVDISLKSAAEKMKYKLANAMKELLVHTPVDKITVKQIVDQCDVTRPTFYRHFKDKYDLINWYFDVLAQMSFKQMGISLTLREGLLKKFEFIKGEGQFFAAAFSSESQNCLMEYDYQCIYQFYCDIIHKQGVDKIPEELEFLLRMYCRGSIAMTVEWATTGMKMSPEQLADQLIDAMPPKLYDLFKDI